MTANAPITMSDFSFDCWVLPAQYSALMEWAGERDSVAAARPGMEPQQFIVKPFAAGVRSKLPFTRTTFVSGFHARTSNLKKSIGTVGGARYQAGRLDSRTVRALPACLPPCRPCRPCPARLLPFLSRLSAWLALKTVLTRNSKSAHKLMQSSHVDILTWGSGER